VSKVPEIPSDNWLDRVRTAISRPFTAGNLLDYGLCPRKFLLSQFAAREQMRALGRFRALHSELRATLVAADKMGGPAALSLEWLRDEFLRNFDGAACADTLEEEQTLRQGLRMLAEFQASQQDSSCELIAADFRFEENVEDLRFAAVADRVECSPQTGLIVARFDSRREPLGPTRLVRDLSMGLLVLLAEAYYGKRPTARIYSLHKNAIYDARLEDADLARVRSRALTVARSVRADAEFNPAPGDHCRWCRVRSDCSAWQERRRSLLGPGGN